MRQGSSFASHARPQGRFPHAAHIDRPWNSPFSTSFILFQPPPFPPSGSSSLFISPTAKKKTNHWRTRSSTPTVSDCYKGRGKRGNYAACALLSLFAVFLSPHSRREAASGSHEAPSWRLPRRKLAPSERETPVNASFARENICFPLTPPPRLLPPPFLPP